MKILFVGLSDNPHTARTIARLYDLGWDIHLFSSDNAGSSSALRDLTIHQFFSRKKNTNPSIKYSGFNWPFSAGRGLFLRLLINVPFFRRLLDPAQRLASLIRRINPDIIHSLGIQHGGYIVNAARQLDPVNFPVWLVTNWGSDIHYSMNFNNEEINIRNVLESADWYSCECNRDIQLARDFGFKGRTWPVFPNAGGVDLLSMEKLRGFKKTSFRKKLLVKGYQHWYGRALVALRAIELCSAQLRDYEIIIYNSSGYDVESAAHILSKKSGLSIYILPRVSHEEIYRLHSESRISISLSTTDGACTSFLEAMSAGSFPIQSNTNCWEEWVEHGKTAFIVHPDDPNAVAIALSTALSDDILVDNSSEINWLTAKARLDANIIRRTAVQCYKDMLL